nr:hypothetical protein CFP56_04179 [Quercus suber]
MSTEPDIVAGQRLEILGTDLRSGSPGQDQGRGGGRNVFPRPTAIHTSLAASQQIRPVRYDKRCDLPATSSMQLFPACRMQPSSSFGCLRRQSRQHADWT